VWITVAWAGALCAQTYDLVIANGAGWTRPVGLDAVRFVRAGWQGGGRSATTLRGRRTMTLAAWWLRRLIDLHSHGQTPENYRFKARTA